MERAGYLPAPGGPRRAGRGDLTRTAVVVGAVLVTAVVLFALLTVAFAPSPAGSRAAAAPDGLLGTALARGGDRGGSGGGDSRDDDSSGGPGGGVPAVGTVRTARSGTRRVVPALRPSAAAPGGARTPGTGPVPVPGRARARVRSRAQARRRGRRPGRRRVPTGDPARPGAAPRPFRARVPRVPPGRPRPAAPRAPAARRATRRAPAFRWPAAMPCLGRPPVAPAPAAPATETALVARSRESRAARWCPTTRGCGMHWRRRGRPT
jgi:hypothetical protein